MKNPWMKKNPLMSMWMSGANAAIGHARGRVAAAGKRQAAAVMTEGTKQMLRLWSGTLTASPTRKKRKPR
jgi:hypothetical protein